MGESYSGIRALADFIRDVAKYQHPVICNVLPEPYAIFHEETLIHMLLDVLLSFVKLGDPSEILFMLSRA